MQTLKTKQEFDLIYKNGKKIYAKGFIVFVYRYNTFSLGLSVSKKVGNACQRNLIKRRLRSLCRIHKDKVRNFVLVFVPRVDILSLSFLELEKEFLRCLHLFHGFKGCVKA